MHAIETRTAAADYDAIVRRLGGKSGGSPLPLPSSVYRRETMGATDAQIRELSAAWPAARHHTLAPRVFDPVGVRLAETEETDCDCVGHEGVTVCERCNNTLTVDAHVDPYDPLRGLSDSVAWWAVRECIVRPALEEYEREHPDEDKTARRIFDGEIRYTAAGDCPVTRFFRATDGVISNYLLWISLDTGELIPGDPRTAAREIMWHAFERAGLDLARWHRRVRAVLAIRDAASAEIERD